MACVGANKAIPFRDGNHPDKAPLPFLQRTRDSQSWVVDRNFASMNDPWYEVEVPLRAETTQGLRNCHILVVTEKLVKL
jgi:hypothetical protein